jgi:hypothetical protein
MDANALTSDPHPRVTKVDLHLMAGSRLKAGRRTFVSFQFSPQMANLQLHRAQANDDPLFGRKLLADHICIAIVPEETLVQPIVKAAESGPANRLLERRCAALP